MSPDLVVYIMLALAYERRTYTRICKPSSCLPPQAKSGDQDKTHTAMSKRGACMLPHHSEIWSELEELKPHTRMDL
jgi:hypothetical protein